MKEDKNKIISGKNIFLIIIMIVLIVIIIAQMYAANHGYGNALFMIKTIFPKEKVIVNDNVSNNGIKSVTKTDSKKTTEKTIEEYNEEESEENNTTQDSESKAENEKAVNSLLPVSQSNINKEKAVSAVKEALCDEDWLKENIYISEEENQFDDISLEDQEIKFAVCTGNRVPAIVVKVSSENAKFRKTILVTYKDEKVKAEIITQGHIYHGDETVDVDKCVVCSEFMHMGDNSIQLYRVRNGEIVSIGKYATLEEYKGGNLTVKYYITENHTETSETKYNEYKADLNESYYSFDEIDIALTKENIEEYIK